MKGFINYKYDVCYLGPSERASLAFCLHLYVVLGTSTYLMMIWETKISKK